VGPGEQREAATTLSISGAQIFTAPIELREATIVLPMMWPSDLARFAVGGHRESRPSP
jgi:hypothetical protein